MVKLSLKCTNCKETYSGETPDQRCGTCGEPLEVEEVNQGKIREGNVLNQSIIERYGDFYPFLDNEDKLSLGEGFTPLIYSSDLSKELDIASIYFKNEGINPTWSFKDRGTLAGVIRAKNLGYKGIGTVSTGNMATSVAAYGAKAKLDTYILVKEGMTLEKLNPIGIYNPKLIKVDGDYSSLYSESLRIGRENNIYFINSDVPLRVEGSKSIAFEICEQLNFDMPDYVVVPTSAGGNIRGIAKGFREFMKAGIIKKLPKLIIVQASGCSPIYNAFKDNTDKISRVNDPNTMAKAIENPYPPSGNASLRLIKRTGGTVVGVTDDEILQAQARLASIGIFAQFASATSLAGVKKLKENGYLNNTDSLVCILTASGLKYTSIIDKHDINIESCSIDNLEEYIKK